jgi:hypothetical protein
LKVSASQPPDPHWKDLWVLQKTKQHPFLVHASNVIITFLLFPNWKNYSTEFTDKAISQNARLLGCVCKTCKNCDNCCCSTRLIAPKKNPWKGEKGTTLFVTL